MIIKYNDFMGNEMIEKEYKEFTFNCAGIILNNKLAEEYCINSIFNFNINVIQNLHKYFSIYIPKYACGFWNSNIENSNLYIGINDYGIVKGIPYKGYLPFRLLKKNILKIINRYVKVLNNTKINYNKMIKIKLIKLSTPDFSNYKSISNTEKFKIYFTEKQKYINNLNKYIDDNLIWNKKLAYIGQRKLTDLVNTYDTRNLLINYIKNIDKNNKFINLLKSSDFKIESKDHFEINIIKNDINNIYYWITKWKDFTLDNIRLSKPFFNNTFNQHNLPYNTICSVNEMIPYWINNNNDVKLYLLNIQFNQNDNNNLIFKYYNFNNEHEKWTSCIRTTFNGGPACVPFIINI
jgi:hypothetical protein